MYVALAHATAESLISLTEPSLSGTSRTVSGDHNETTGINVQMWE